MFMQKRGQTTIFIAVGLVIVIIIALFFFIRGNIGPVGKEVPFTTKGKEVQDYVQNCIDETVKESLMDIGSRGGYYSSAPLGFLSYEGKDYAYYYKTPNFEIPTTNEIETNLENYFLDHIGNCIKDFELFKGKGYDITFKTPVVDFTLYDNNVVASVSYPITVSKGTSKSELNEFDSVEIGFGIKNYRDIAENQITANQDDLASRGDYSSLVVGETNVEPIEDDTDADIVLLSTKRSIQDEIYEFAFAVRME